MTEVNSKPNFLFAPAQQANSAKVSQFVEVLLDAQRQWLELLSAQNQLLFKTIRQEVEVLRSNPVPTASEEPKPEAATSAPPAIPNVTGLVSQPLQMIAEAGRRWIDTANAQNTQILESVNRVFGVQNSSPAAPYAYWTQDALSNYAEFNKRWINLLTQLPVQLSPTRFNGN